MTRKATYPAGSIKRVRRTNAQIEQLEAQILEILKEDRPQSIRHIFYRLTDPRWPEPVKKTENAYEQVGDRITKMRRSGTLPYGWITDTTRRGFYVDTFDGAADFLRRVKGLYRADLWKSADLHCEVWVESRSIAGVIQNDCDELAVNLFPCGGFPSLTLAYQAAAAHNARRDSKPLMIIYVGDYDPAGVLIDVTLERELRTHLRSDIDMGFVRLGITLEQIETLGLPTNPRKPKDKRAPHLKWTVEAESMPAHLMRELVRTSVEALLPEGALEAAKMAEKSELQLIDGLAGMLATGGAS